MLEALLLAASCSLDAFVASIAYGTNKVKIPFLSVQIINVVCSCILALSLFCGSILRKILPGNTSVIISFIALFILGMRYIMNSISKTYINKDKNFNKKLNFKLCNFNFNVNVSPTEEKRDFKKLENLNSQEALYLAIALSLDAIAVGIASALANVNLKLVVFFSFITDAVFVWFGLYIGNKLVEKLNLNLSWLSGIILIGLAITKVI